MGDTADYKGNGSSTLPAFVNSISKGKYVLGQKQAVIEHLSLFRYDDLF